MSDDAGGRVADAGAEPTDGDREAAKQRAAVRERYGRIARDAGDGAGDDACGGGRTDDDACSGDGTDDADTDGSCCGDSAVNDSCCGDSADNDSCCGEDATGANDDGYDRALGYSEADVEDVAAGANLQLGCGNPTALANLRTGETVLDLGSGAGFDCFLAAREVGPEGRVLGVDMTPDMVEKARENVRKNDAGNVEFRLGEIEHLPVADGSVDVVISNCVVNLSPDKPQVFREAYRVLRPGGRVAISDVVLTAEPPVDRAPDPDSVAACVAGASPIPALETMLADAGFEDVSIAPKDDSEFVREWDDDRDLTEFLVSATIEGRKPEPSTAR